MSARVDRSKPNVSDRTRSGALSLAVGHALLVALLFVVALVVRLYQLDHQPLWLDEGTTWAQVTRQPLGALIINLFRPTEAYPLYHLLLKLTTRLLGDSEWALRLPSAVAGALAVPALYALGRELRGSFAGVLAALLLLVSPFAIWQAQDAKAYSLVLLTAIGLALAFARALRRNTRREWIIFALVALVAPFVHRWLLFALVACGVAYGLVGSREQRTENKEQNAFQSKIQNRVPRRGESKIILIGSIAAGLALVVVVSQSLAFLSAGAQFDQVGPVRAAWLTFGKFSVDQFPDAVPWFWLLPFGLLALIGLIRLLFDLRDPQTRHSAIVILTLGGVPALLFALLFLRLSLYEPRYLILVLPFWLLVQDSGVRLEASGWRRQVGGVRFQKLNFGSWFLVLGSSVIVLCSLFFVLLLSYLALYLPDQGLFSGAIVKEDYREAVTILADHVHPDDLVIVHPDTIQPLYDYYAPRVSDQPLPKAKAYGWLGRTNQDDPQVTLRELDFRIRQDFAQHKRAWLIIAPDHANKDGVDPPVDPHDRFGLVGLAFQYAAQNNRLPCGEPREYESYANLNGVMLYCNNIPKVADQNGRDMPPQPQVAHAAVFGDQLRLRGYTVTPWSNGIRSGGTLPISLFWEPIRSLEGTNYKIFVHLTRLDDPKPLAQSDYAPLEGGWPTDRWTTPGALLHDDRTIRLINEETGEPIPAGRYKLWVGVYRPDQPTAIPADARLPISGTTQPTLDNALELGEVEVQGR